MKKLILGLALATTAGLLRADEGMWMPQQIPALKPRLEALGYKGDPSIFADLTGFPMGAIVSLGGCSASFVSPQGLIVTNHHCVQAALQFNSRPDRDLMSDGYLAHSMAEELPAGPGSHVFVTLACEDVTEKVMAGVTSQTPDRERYEIIEANIKKLTAEREKEAGTKCTISSYYEGFKYFAVTQLEIQDVRLVYAPAKGIGNFGGEEDNWRWPRHTGDYSYIRAYVGKDGHPAAYSKDNVPYQPKHFLKVSSQGVKPGDLVFVAGFPGRTARLTTFDSMHDLVVNMMPRTIRRYSEQIDILEKISVGDKETGLRVSTRIRGFNNALTKTKGVYEAMEKGGLQLEKAKTDAELQAWIDADAGRKARYGTVIADIRALVAERAATRERNLLTAEFMGGQGSAIGAAETLYRLAVERAKPDAKRDPMFQERNWFRIKEGLERMQRSLSLKADTVIMRYQLASIATLPADKRIPALDTLVGLKPGMPEAEATAAINTFVDRVLAGTKLYDREQRMGLFEADVAKLEASSDSLLKLAAALYPFQEELREVAKTREGAQARLGSLYAQAQLEKAGGLVAPDANSTLRVTYGVVKGVDQKDGIYYKPQTSLKGVSQKNRGSGEFDAPKTELDAIARLRQGAKTPYVDAGLGDVPVDFLSTVDTTGGNSGSATLNAKGELVGLLFDGTYETVASDYIFDTVNTRSIHCDSRYMLWLMSEVDKADNLLKEMEIR